jgi:Flp pilus assembly protein TadG
MHNRVRKIRLLRRLSRIAKIRGFSRDERGIQLVELAIVLPILMLMFAATAEFGRFFYEYTTLAKAARGGARYLVTAANCPAIDAQAKNLVVYGNTDGTGDPVISGLTTSNVQIIRKDSNGNVQPAGVPQTVTIGITGFKYEPMFGLGSMTGSQSLNLNIDLAAAATMRYLLTTPLLCS